MNFLEILGVIFIFQFVIEAIVVIKYWHRVKFLLSMVTDYNDNIDN